MGVGRCSQVFGIEECEGTFDKKQWSWGRAREQSIMEAAGGRHRASPLGDGLGQLRQPKVSRLVKHTSLKLYALALLSEFRQRRVFFTSVRVGTSPTERF